MTVSVFIDTNRLLRVFDGSPLSHREIRRRLGNPKRCVVTAVLRSAVTAGFLRQVAPHEVGSAKYSVAVFTLTKKAALLFPCISHPMSL